MRCREETKIVEYQEDRKNKIIKYNAMNYKENYVPPKMNRDAVLEVESVILTGSDTNLYTNGQERQIVEDYGNYWENN